MNAIGRHIIQTISETPNQVFTKEEIIKLVTKATAINCLPVVELDGIRVDPSSFKTTKENGETLIFTNKEFNLLYLLISHPERSFRRHEILNEVWGNDVIVNDRTIDVHIRRIREKLGNSNIITNKGIGYLWSSQG